MGEGERNEDEKKYREGKYGEDLAIGERCKYGARSEIMARGC